MKLVKLKIDSGEMSDKKSADMVKSVEKKSAKMGMVGGDLSEDRDLQLGEILTQSISR